MKIIVLVRDKAWQLDLSLSRLHAEPAEEGEAEVLVHLGGSFDLAEHEDDGEEASFRFGFCRGEEA